MSSAALGVTIGAALSLATSVGIATPTSAAVCIDWCVVDAEIEARMSGIDYVRVRGRADPKEYLYTASCYIDDEVRTADGCVDGIIPEPEESCTTGTMARPRWARLRDTGNGDGPWILEAGYTCPGDSEFPITFDDFAVLPISPSPLRIQPDAEWVYAGLDTIGLTDDAGQGFQVTLLGADFSVAAIPVEYSWDFGDGSSPLVTTDPGKPWPDHTVSHRYTASGTATPELTTRWKGFFRELSIDPWTEIDGTAETTTTGTQLTIHTARTRLVEDDLS